MQRTALLLGVSAAVAALATPSSAQFDPRLFRTPEVTTPIPLGDLDARLDADGQALPFVRAALAASRTPQVLAARELALERLRRRVPGVAVDAHDVFGTPHFVRSTLAFLSAPTVAGKADAEGIVRGFLDEYRGLFEVSPGELSTAEVTRDFETAHNGMRHLTWKQRHEGVKIAGCELRANLTERGEIVNLSSTLIPRPEEGFQPSPQRVSDFEAVLLAASSVGITITNAPNAAGAPAGAERRREWVGSPDFRADDALTTEFTWFPRTRGELRPAWLVTIPEIGIGNTYDVTIDATDGTVLRRWNHLHFAAGGTQPITMRVFTSDSPAPGSPGNPTPNGFQFPLVPTQLVTITGAQVAPWSPNGWIDDNGNETLGNNVDAHTDLNADNVADLPRPSGTPARTFDFAIDTTQAPSTYRPGAVTQVFYLANRYHDRLMELGFDEAAKNFQATNFSAQGVGGDRVLADCQDGSGTNNANFGTNGTDGGTGRMQMYVFSGPTPDRDGDLDADIVFHELTHGTSIRLLDGTASGEQAGGMGEGWGDFFGLCLNSEPTDDPNGVYATGGWTVYQLSGGFAENYYFGIRRFPYTTDLNKNPQTFADIDPAQQNYPPAIPRSTLIGNTADEVHNVGEVWCVTLWEARAGLIGANGPSGNDLIQQLVVDGLKLSPGTPSFVQARDAILQADLVANGGVNLGVLWNAFAKRGLGASATAPAGTTTTGVVEAFDTPNLILFAYPNGRPEQLAPGVPTTFQVQAVGLGAAVPTPGTGQLLVSVNGGPFVANSMTQTTPNRYDATIPANACLANVRYYVTTATNTTPASDPSAAPAVTNAAIVATGVQDVLYDDFQVDLGWTATNLGATSGDWQRGVPVNDPTWTYDPTGDGDGSGSCWLTQNAAGNTDVDAGAVQLMSSSFDFSAYGTIEYEYYLFLTVADGSDRLLVEISPNGAAGPWTTIAVHDSNGDTNWRSAFISSTTVAGLGVPLTNNTRLRFTANDGGAQSIVEAGIDGLRISRLVCTAPPTAYCFGDGTGGACPCGNNGAAGQGCANSLGNGGVLSASGTAVVAADTLVLAGSGMPNSSALYFQGTIQDNGGAGVAFGDGLRCTSGSIIRLGTKSNVSGASTYPALGDPTVSVRGLVPGTGGTRNYQAWYRNAASFCTASTFNLTNAVSVVWTP
ncbi:MAG: M36 family metallopeptidase [Planctomycetota bacterium]|nr:M36 family metallopeptidase [Planctomycetota bacterium]